MKQYKKMALTAIAALWTASIMQSQSPYIHRVYEYMPAPGQFVNELPEYRPGNTQADMNRKAEEAIAGANHNVGMITLGGYGGYIVFGFDHPVENVSGKYDFHILGNAFYADANPNSEAPREGGSAEPGIVMVARDANGNGLPDDPWYELAGSEYRKPATIHNYRITYHRPDDDKPRTPHPSNPALNDIEYIRWTTNGHGDGYLFRNTYHAQSYYPLWTDGETLSFEGTKLADNYVDESGQGTYYVLYAYHWGYADNLPNAVARSAFSIEWAVDGDGNPAHLPEIDFVKVYTGVNQYCGWLGETSTEVSGAEDLHLTGRDVDVPVFAAGVAIEPSAVEMQPGETTTLTAVVLPADATNKTVRWTTGDSAVASISAGTVRARVDGETVVRVITNDGYYIAECRVTVKTPPAPPEPPTPPAPPEPDTVAVTGVAIEPSVVEMQPGETAMLVAAVQPADATNKAITWASSDTRVAIVTVNGLLIADAPGAAVITVATVDGDFRAECAVTVADPQATGIRYADGALHLRNLRGCDCTLLSLAGQTLLRFRAGDDGRVAIRLPRGIYILRAEKTVFKIMISDND